MLRITVNNSADETRFLVEGKLAGGCVAELERCWRAEGSNVDAGAIVVDLSNVSFIDSFGKQLLTMMHENGTKFVAHGLLPKCLVEEICTSTFELECQSPED